MDLNLIQDPSPYSSVETNLGYTNASCMALKSLPSGSDGPGSRLYQRNGSTAAHSHDSPIDTIVLSIPKNRGAVQTVASDEAAQPIVIQMPATASTDDFTYALEHVL